MPLEVRQIGIRLNVGEGAGPGSGGEAGNDGGDSGPAGAQAIDPAERAEIIEECVGAVLDALRMQGER